MRFATAAICLTALLLQGCITSGSGESAEANASPAYVPEAGLSEKARFRRVLVLLERGQADKARADLLVYLQSQPRSDIARDLLQQIDTPAADYFPAESRTVTLKTGYSLSTLAKVYLGSVYRFYALAKYNGIDEARNLTAGQAIRIPLTREAKVAFAAEAEVGTNALESGELAEEMPVPLESGDEADAQSDLFEDAPLDEANEGDEELRNAADIEHSDDSPDPGVIVPEPVDPAIQAAKVDAMHRDALNAYRAQNLDKAISLWDQLLEFDPNHENARLYRSQAVELKQKLNNLL